MKIIGNILLACLIFMISCGPSMEEINAIEKAKSDAIEKSKFDSINRVLEKQKIAAEEKNKKYFLANQFDLIPGKIVGWAPTDDEIEKWKCNGGTVPDRIIYIHIQDQYGMVTVMKCNQMAWINLHTGDILR